MEETSITVSDTVQAQWEALHPEQPYIKGRLYNDPKAHINIKGLWYALDEVEQVKRQHAVDQAIYRRREREQWLETPHGKLCMELYEKFQEYKKYLAEHPWASAAPAGFKLITAKETFPEHALFAGALTAASDYQQERAARALRNLEKARAAARCEHKYLDGQSCRAPRLKHKKLCRIHAGMEAMKGAALELGSMEDPDSIQMAIMRLQHAILDRKLDPGQIGQLSYLIQLAAWNVSRTTFGNRTLPQYLGEPEETAPAK
jgi:hypothetical protein